MEVRINKRGILIILGLETLFIAWAIFICGTYYSAKEYCWFTVLFTSRNTVIRGNVHCNDTIHFFEKEKSIEGCKPLYD